MKVKSRISSILKTHNLDYSITGLPAFNLSDLKLFAELEFQLPTNLRLGHLSEKIVSELIKSSSNYKVLYENVQLIEDNKTIGELDFIIEEIESKQIVHMELAYKFYLYDPTIAVESINNWIGPNRNDSLKEKLEKLKRKQFPLLYHKTAKTKISETTIVKASQALCLLASLFIPFKFNGIFSSSYEKAIKGYYLNFETFISLDEATQTYYIPEKKEWGMDPSENEMWSDLKGVQEFIRTSINEKKAPLVWQKNKNSYLTFFIVWWDC